MPSTGIPASSNAVGHPISEKQNNAQKICDKANDVQTPRRHCRSPTAPRCGGYSSQPQNGKVPETSAVMRPQFSQHRADLSVSRKPANGSPGAIAVRRDIRRVPVSTGLVRIERLRYARQDGPKGLTSGPPAARERQQRSVAG